MMAFLEVRELNKRFGRTQVLNGVSFDLNEGEALAVLGSSGNGKTTLLRCLNFLELAEAGSITVDGRQVFDGKIRYRERELRENRLSFGLVFQGFHLFPQYTALRNVSLALDIRAKTRLREERRRARERGNGKSLKAAYAENARIAKELLVSVGLGEKLDRYPCELSGGQCQRVAIARAMALQPKILCFDEPTSALDPELTGEVLRVIGELKRSGKVTMIIVTHEMEFARSVSDKTLFLSEGRALEYGDTPSFFNSPKTDEARQFLRNYLKEKI